MKTRTIAMSLVALATLLVPSVSSARQTKYSVTIPKVLSYPTTRLTFSSSAVFPGLKSVKPADVRVQFDNPEWAATVSEAHWNTSHAGTYFKFACQATSSACLKAAGPSGTYTYVLEPEGAAAPSKNGQYSYTWDVRPPGDQIQDVIAVTPEPATLPLLAIGLLGLLLVARRKLVLN
jgi:PEP-CTERM motif-containing protein